MSGKPRQPSGLGKAGAALWRAILGQLDDDGLVPDAREQQWLALACREADQLAAVEAALAGQSLTTLGSAKQLVAHPLLGECRASRQVIAGLLARVGLDDPLAVASGGSGSRTTTAAGRRAALIRHHGRS